MAITTQFLTGFEHGFVGSAAAVAGGGLTGGTTTPGSGWTASTSSPRNGSYCAHLVRPVNTATTLIFPATGNPTKAVVRFGFKIAAGHVGAVEVFSIQNSTPLNIVTVDISTGGVPSVTFSGAVQNAPAITDGVWHLFEMQVDTVAKTVDWKVDGVAKTQVVGSGTPINVATVTFGASSASGPTYTADYDDLIFGTWTVAGTDWYGDGKALAQLAGSDGTHNYTASSTFSFGEAGTLLAAGVTNANTMVDDAAGSGGWTATRSTTDNLAMRATNTAFYLEIAPATTAETGAANAVRAIVSSSSTAATANLAACIARNSAGTVTAIQGTINGTGAAFNQTTNQFKAAIVTVATTWTAAEVNAVRFRFGGCTSSDIAPVPTVQALMLEVDWPILPPVGIGDITSPVTGTPTPV